MMHEAGEPAAAPSTLPTSRCTSPRPPAPRRLLPHCEKLLLHHHSTLFTSGGIQRDKLLPSRVPLPRITWLEVRRPSHSQSGPLSRPPPAAPHAQNKNRKRPTTRAIFELYTLFIFDILFFCLLLSLFFYFCLYNEYCVCFSLTCLYFAFILCC